MTIPATQGGGEVGRGSGPAWGRLAVIPLAFEPGNDAGTENAADEAQQLPEQDISDVRRKQRMTEKEGHQCSCRKIEQPVHDNSTQAEEEAFRFDRLTAKA